MQNHEPHSAIPALLPRDKGCQFVVYGDACSGVLKPKEE